MKFSESARVDDLFDVYKPVYVMFIVFLSFSHVGQVWY